MFPRNFLIACTKWENSKKNLSNVVYTKLETKKIRRQFNRNLSSHGNKFVKVHVSHEFLSGIRSLSRVFLSNIFTINYLLWSFKRSLFLVFVSNKTTYFVERFVISLICLHFLSLYWFLQRKLTSFQNINVCFLKISFRKCFFFKKVIF